MTTALAADVHDAPFCTSPASRRRHLRQLAEQVDRFSPCEIRRALDAWATGPASEQERTRRWQSLLADVRLLSSLQTVRDRPAYAPTAALLETDIARSLTALVSP